jgi:hypothetical protein
MEMLRYVVYAEHGFKESRFLSPYVGGRQKPGMRVNKEAQSS